MARSINGPCGKMMMLFQQKKLYPLWLCLSIVASPAIAAAVFHAPVTEQEKALDVIVMQASHDVKRDETPMHMEISEKTWHNSAKIRNEYSHLFTRKLMDAIHAAETRQVQENCGGHYRQGDLCGLGYNPLLCAQDVSDQYLYATEKESGREAVIRSKWPNEHDFMTYKLIKEGNEWKVDGIDCASLGTQFNMK
jgi:hypothetical protein